MLNNNLIDVLEKNEGAIVGSFMYKLHEEDIFDEEAFLEYCRAICLIFKDSCCRGYISQVITNMSYIQSNLVNHLSNLNKKTEGWKVEYYGEGLRNYTDMKLNMVNISWCIHNIVSKLSFISDNELTFDDICEYLALSE